MTDDRYRPTIGIECHVQLKTRSKLFSSVANDARSAEPNTLISHIDFGLPGALPVLNQEALKLVIKAALALNTKPERFSKFDRKHYFYPDLPKGYQISQYDQPVIAGGHVVINVNGQTKRIGIVRAHLEEDAGKTTHPGGADYSLVDLNRAGTPLIEIVSQPDLNSAAEAKAYARELYLVMKYAGVSDADLFHGNIRFDVNVSLSDSAKLGTRTETKNLNSFRAVEKAVEYEVKRQVGILKKGQSVTQETRGWDEAKQRTFTQRTKEEAEDYRYMPDPDLPPLVLDQDLLKSVQKEMPTMPSEWRKILSKLDLSQAFIETLLDAELSDNQIDYLSLIETTNGDSSTAKFLANWFVNVEIPLRLEAKLKLISDNHQRLAYYLALKALLDDDKLNSTSAKNLLKDLLASQSEIENVENYAKQQGYVQLSDRSALDDIVKKVMTANPRAIEDIKNGENKAVGFLVGQVMKESRGQANPKLAEELIRQNL